MDGFGQGKGPAALEGNPRTLRTPAGMISDSAVGSAKERAGRKPYAAKSMGLSPRYARNRKLQISDFNLKFAICHPAGHAFATPGSRLAQRRPQR